MGESINIIGQPWLNDEVNRFVETNHQDLKGHKVCFLFCLDRKVWDGDVIRDMFNERDQECIFNTPVEDSINRDVVFWIKESSGNYSVKSAYNLLQSMKGH